VQVCSIETLLTGCAPPVHFACDSLLVRRLPLVRHVNSGTRQFTDYTARAPCSPLSRRRQGVDQKDLGFRTYESFAEQGLPAELQQKRYDRYCQKREERLRLVRREFEAIVFELENSAVNPKLASRIYSAASVASGGVGTSGSVGSAGPPSGGPAKSSAFIEAERRQLEKVQRRQKQELETMMAQEMRAAAMAEENERKHLEELEREAARARQKQERARQALEEKRAKEAARAAAEAAEEERRRLAAQAAYEEERRLQRIEEQKEAETKRAAVAAQQQKAAKAQQLKEQTDAILNEQVGAARRWVGQGLVGSSELRLPRAPREPPPASLHRR
jgi:hypothetical protein